MLPSNSATRTAALGRSTPDRRGATWRRLAVSKETLADSVEVNLRDRPLSGKEAPVSESQFRAPGRRRPAYSVEKLGEDWAVNW